jgi:UDP-N-acetyl-D-galactosamine dehydrogenase
VRATFLTLGITFKEICPDIRNRHAVDVVRGLEEFGCKVDIYDPWANPEEIAKEYGLTSVQSMEKLKDHVYDAVVLTVAHREFMEFDLARRSKPDSVVFDIKGFLPRDRVNGRL